MEDSELKEFSSALKNNLIGKFSHFTFFHFSAILLNLDAGDLHRKSVYKDVFSLDLDELTLLQLLL